MTVDAQHPENFGGDLAFQFDDCGCNLIELGAAGRLQIGPAGVEEYFRLQDETIADDADVGTVAENFPELTEKIRAVARQLLNVLGERGNSIGQDLPTGTVAAIPSPGVFGLLLSWM